MDSRSGNAEREPVGISPREALGRSFFDRLNPWSPNRERRNPNVSQGFASDLLHHAALPLSGAMLIAVGMVASYPAFERYLSSGPKVEIALPGAPIPTAEIPPMPDDLDAPQRIDRTPRLPVPVITNGEIGLPKPPTEPLRALTDDELKRGARYNQDGRVFEQE
jgi:hypothetical protein